MRNDVSFGITIKKALCFRQLVNNIIRSFTDDLMLNVSMFR